MINIYNISWVFNNEEWYYGAQGGNIGQIHGNAAVALGGMMGAGGELHVHTAAAPCQAGNLTNAGNSCLQFYQDITFHHPRLHMHVYFLVQTFHLDEVYVNANPAAVQNGICDWLAPLLPPAAGGQAVGTWTYDAGIGIRAVNFDWKRHVLAEN